MKDLGSKTDLIYSSKMSGTSNLDKDNIISTFIEELSEEERQDYLLATEHINGQFLKGFKKDQKGQVMKV